MKHIFLDTSILIAFSGSFTGGSAYILDCCERGKVKGYVSQKVVFETRKNAAAIMGEATGKAIEYIFNQGFLTIVPDCTEQELKTANQAFHNPKDAPIIASAKQMPEVTFLLSLDNGFFKPHFIAYVKPIAVIKPGDFINRFRDELK
jgi:predicted nucleic acid-binding protein